MHTMVRLTVSGTILAFGAGLLAAQTLNLSTSKRGAWGYPTDKALIGSAAALAPGKSGP